MVEVGAQVDSNPAGCDLVSVRSGKCAGNPRLWRLGIDAVNFTELDFAQLDFTQLDFTQLDFAQLDFAGARIQLG